MKSFILSPHLIISLVASLAVYVNNAKETQLEPNEFQDLSGELIREFNANHKDEYHWMIKKLISLKKSLVISDNDGLITKYKVKFSTVRTDCLKLSDDIKILSNLCRIQDSAPKYICRYSILIDQETENKKFVEHDCHKHHRGHKHIGKYDRIDNQAFGEEGENKGKSISKMEKNIDRISRTIKLKDLQTWDLFKGFLTRHSKIYKTKEELVQRFRTYKRNLKIAQILQLNERGTAIYGETKFSDLTPDEFKKIYLPYVWQKPSNNSISELDADDDRLQMNEPLPASFDWRTKGVVTEVKNQQACGSCWAFSVTGNVEGQWAIKTGKLVSLSEQELLDCDTIDKACNGGLPANAYREIIRMGGLESEKEYPYDAHRESCKLKITDMAAYINDSVQLPSNEEQMVIFLFKSGPISVGVNANPLQFYRHGISHPWKIFCSKLFLDHGVLIVGYGVEKNKPFWIIKNSWGNDWGESGYYRMFRGENVCGVSEMATSSIVK